MKKGLKPAIAMVFVALGLVGCAGTKHKHPGEESFLKIDATGKRIALEPLRDVRIFDTTVFRKRWQGIGFPKGGVEDGTDRFFSDLLALSLERYLKKGTFQHDSTASEVRFFDTVVAVPRDSLVKRSKPDNRFSPPDTTIEIIDTVLFGIREPRLSHDSGFSDFAFLLGGVEFRDEFFMTMKGGNLCSGTQVKAKARYAVWNRRTGRIEVYGYVEVGSDRCGPLTRQDWLRAVDALGREMVSRTPFADPNAPDGFASSSPFWDYAYFQNYLGGKKVPKEETSEDPSP